MVKEIKNMLENLSKYNILLASKSPRRHELFSQLRIPFKTVTINGIDEAYPTELETVLIPAFIAEKKINAYLKKFTGNELIITADTLVILDKEVMGKPKDYDDAVRMLKQLSGKIHKVVTGVCIATRDKKCVFSVDTEVKFINLSENDIEYYVTTFRPYDKAGSYGIQEWIGYIGVEWIKGSYFNVMGLPVQRLYKELKKF